MGVRVCCVSDLHGHLPVLPPHDLLLIAGDVCPAVNHTPAFQWKWLRQKLLPWINAQKSDCVLVWGNHDLLAEQDMDILPADLRELAVTDRAVECCGLKIWGSPWQLKFCNWAFNLSESDLAAKYAAIPDDVDIIVTHGPPYGAGDLTVDGRRVGSPSLTEAIQRIRPRLVVTGHIHNARGTHRLFDSYVVNAAVCDEDYRPTGEPVMVELGVAVA